MSVTEEAQVITTPVTAGQGRTGGAEISCELLLAFLGSLTLTLPRNRPELPEDASRPRQW